MKRLLLVVGFSLFFLVYSIAYAENYQPLVVTFRDAYVYYVQKVKNALMVRDHNNAVRYYKIARIYAASKTEAIEIDMLMHSQITVKEIKVITELNQPKKKQGSVIDKALDVEEALGETHKVIPVSPSLTTVVKNISDKQSIELKIGQSLIIERNEVKRFFIVDEGFIDVKRLNSHQIQITALKRGSTYLHIWDENGRTTLNIKVIFFVDTESQIESKPKYVEHNDAFKFSYSNDWSAYYQGAKVPDLQRQNLSFLQNIGLEGPTPLGDVDSYMIFSGFDRAQQIESYSLGVNRIPVQGVDNFNLRFFDAVRNLSPFTMASPHLRGVFADVDVLNKNLRFSYSHGQVRPAFGFLAFSNSNKFESYVDAGKITLFPNNSKSKYALNYAVGHGRDRSPEIAKSAYSIEAQQKIYKMTLNAELARNSEKRNAVTSGLRYDNNGFMTSVNARNVNKQYTNILNSAYYQGEVGATWSTSTYTDRFDAQTYVDVYQNRLYFNPDDEDALNLDSSGRVHFPITARIWNDVGLNYVTTPGELSPRTNFGFDDRISLSFDTWNKRNGIVYTGGTYQRTRYEKTQESAFDRLTALFGLSLPLTDKLSVNSRYEYSWVTEPYKNIEYNPNSLDMGLNYNREITKKLLGTWGLNYRREDGVGGSNSFLAGEDSLYGSFGLTYNPLNDVSVFFDSRLRRVWPKSDDIVAYYALDLRLGLRMQFGSGVRFDPYGKVYGHVFNDSNSNGKKENGEEGIPDVNVKVGDKEVTTNAQGYYEQSYHAKAVAVRPDPASVPAGHVFSTKDNVHRPIQQFSSNRVDFGVTTHSSVYGIFYVDKNSNGQPDLGDQFVSKVKVTLNNKDVQYTDGRGAYYFRNIGEGKHTIVFDLNTIPIEMVPLGKFKNTIDIERGSTFVLHFPLRIKEQQ